MQQQRWRPQLADCCCARHALLLPSAGSCERNRQDNGMHAQSRSCWTIDRYLAAHPAHLHEVPVDLAALELGRVGTGDGLHPRVLEQVDDAVQVGGKPQDITQLQAGPAADATAIQIAL